MYWGKSERPGVSSACCFTDINVTTFTDIKYIELDTCSVVWSFMAAQLYWLEQRFTGIQPVKPGGESATFF